MRLLRNSLFLAMLATLLAALAIGPAHVAVAAPAQADNLLKNPSFEPDLKSWATFYVPGDGCGRQQPKFEAINKSVDKRREIGRAHV